MEDDIKGKESVQDDINPLSIIDNQLDVVTYLNQIDNDTYDKLLEDKIKVMTRALKVIYKAQESLLKDL
jgi:hypothetical protein